MRKALVLAAVAMVIFGSFTGGCGQTDENASVAGVWAGSYTWNCSNTKSGSSPLVLTLTQENDKISGTAAYLNDVSALTGTVAGSVVTLQITGTSAITSNWFSGTAVQNSINGTTMNGENCSAPSGPSGSFVLIKQTSITGTADKLALFGPEYVTSGKCSSAFAIESHDSAAVPSALATSAMVSLVGGGSGVFYADRNCTRPVSSVTIPAGGTSQNFFLKDDLVESVTITASDAAGTLAGAGFAVVVVGHGGSITFDLDGSPVDHSTSSQATVYLGTDILGFWGYDVAGNFFNIFVPPQAGTYTCNSGVSMYYQNAGGAQWGGYSGFGACSVTVTSIGTLGTSVTGTFSGNLTAQFGGASGTRTITNGQFSMIRGLP